ncbi:MAG: SH3 domain-containing protein [Chloroflexi bacterium]|nr:SH3 domain-containing protein [Chloroflexota bacterium]
MFFARGLFLAGIVWVLAGHPVIAQEAPLETSAHRAAVVYAGPGDSYRQLAVLRAGNAVQIIERNNIGNWLHVQEKDRNGFVKLDGWVMMGYLNHPAELRFSRLPVNTELADADLSTVRSRSLAALYAAPVISPISEAMREVYALGQQLGNHSDVVTKVGDSLTFNPMYLEPMSDARYDLGPYDYLEDALLYFGPSTAGGSAAARMALATYVIFDPMWADKTLCQPDEPPLDCEYRRKQPSVAFILFGPNDARHTTREKYTEQMDKIVSETLNRGIIPVLSTFSAHPDETYWQQSIELNLGLLDVAARYDVPLINLWAAARALPDYGLDIDKVHMKNSGFTYLKFSTGHESWYGTSLRNLLTLKMLDEIYHKIILEADS